MWLQTNCAQRRVLLLPTIMGGLVFGCSTDIDRATGLDPALRLSDNGKGAVRVRYRPASLDWQFGRSMCSVKDIDGDGVHDIAVGAPGHRFGDKSRRGKVLVFSGRTSELLCQWQGGGEGDEYGYAMCRFDVNDGSDGVGLLIGAPGARAASGRTCGSVEAVDVKSGGHLWGASGGLTGIRFGEGVAYLRGDDGRGHIVVSDPMSVTDDGVCVGRLTWLSAVAGTREFTTLGPMESTPSGISLYGHKMTACSDIDGDGTEDLVVSLGGQGGLQLLASSAGRALAEYGRGSDPASGITSVIAFDDCTGDGRREVMALGQSVGFPNRFSPQPGLELAWFLDVHSGADLTRLARWTVDAPDSGVIGGVVWNHHAKEAALLLIQRGLPPVSRGGVRFVDCADGKVTRNIAPPQGVAFSDLGFSVLGDLDGDQCPDLGVGGVRLGNGPEAEVIGAEVFLISWKTGRILGNLSCDGVE
jgi:hypothetical protein